MVKMRPWSNIFRKLFAAGLCTGLSILVSCGGKDTSKSGQPCATSFCSCYPTGCPHPLLTLHILLRRPPGRHKRLAAQKPDPVATTIADAEKAYESGQSNYQAGHRMLPSRTLIAPWTS